MDADRVVIADVMRPRGNCGELLVRSQSDVPGRMESLRQATVRLAGGGDVTVRVESAWEHKGDWVLKLEAVDSIDDAERFRGAEIWVPAGERGTLAVREFFQSDLIGCALVDATTGTTLGVVEGWRRHGGPPLMEVRVDGREALIPFVDAICTQVDIAGRKVLVDLPEGLLEL